MRTKIRQPHLGWEWADSFLRETLGKSTVLREKSGTPPGYEEMSWGEIGTGGIPEAGKPTG